MFAQYYSTELIYPQGKKRKQFKNSSQTFCPKMRAVCMAELGQMPTHGMNGFILLVNLLISSTSKLYKYMQHTSWPTVCGTNTHLFQSLFSHLSCFTKCACSLEQFQSHAVAHVGKRRWQDLGGHHLRPSPKPPLTYYHVRPDAREGLDFFIIIFFLQLKLLQN